MSTIADAMQDIFSGQLPQEDEYVNTEDVIYCKKCHTPRQIRHEFRGRLITPYVMCQCRKERTEKQKEEQAKRDFQTEVSRLKAAGLQEQKLRDYCFANDSGVNP